MSPNEIEQHYWEALDQGHRTIVFNDIQVSGGELVGQDLRCSKWIRCHFERTQFVDCDLRGADFSASNLDQVRFVRCSMYGCELPENTNISLCCCVLRGLWGTVENHKVKTLTHG